jgi:cyclophilin family peptidyl-prolyl cis-trans isomerase
MTVENRGKVVIQFFPKAAPKTVGHFLDLVRRKFYDGLLFHRVVPNFVIQAGDPASRKLSAQEITAKDDHAGGTAGLGGGGSGTNGATAGIPYEETDGTHEPGTVSLALSGPRTATGDSQFFINLKPNHSLDGDYCVFGRVISGMDVVMKIKRGDKISGVALLPKSPAR